MELTVDLLKQLAILDGLLAGLALAASVRFVTGNQRTALISATIVTLLFASLALITTASFAVLLMGHSETVGDIPIAVKQLSGVFIILSLPGLTTFLAGIALVGWVWSRNIGIALTVTVAVAVLSIWIAWELLP